MDTSSVVFGSDGRIRSGWRFAIFACGFIFIASVCGFILSRVLSPNAGLVGSTTTFIAFDAAILVPALVVGWLCTRYLDKLPFRSLGASFTGGWLRHFVVGAGIGAVTLSIAVLIAFIFGGLTFSPDPLDWNSIGRTLILAFLVFTVSAAAEEALCRGYAMQTFFHSDLKVFGIVFTALLFASGHLGNPSSSALAWLNTFLAGIWFGIAYWKTGDLWFPFGMHLMWNWMQGAFFGIEVSGLTSVTSAPLLKEIDRGPAWLTGESYGIEAGIACTAALILSTAAIYFFPLKKPAQD
jgi:membrane protease YdiL (CAAX protease family)